MTGAAAGSAAGSAAGGMYGAGISGILNILNTAINHELNNRSIEYTADLNYKYGEKAADNADRRTRALYNDLYSPQARLQQLKDAGLSAGLMYGTAGAGGTTSTAGAMGHGAGNQQAKANFLDILQNAAIQSEINRNNAEANKSNADARKSNADAEVTEQTGTEEAFAKIAELQARAGNEKAQATFTELQSDFQDIQNEIAKETKDYQIELIDYQAEKMLHDSEKAYYESLSAKYNAEVDEETVNERIQQVALQNQNLMVDILVKQSEIGLNNAQAQTAIQNATTYATSAKFNAVTARAEVKQRREIFEKQLKFEIEKFGIETEQKNTGMIVESVNNAIRTLGYVYGASILTNRATNNIKGRNKRKPVFDKNGNLLIPGMPMRPDGSYVGE